MNHIRATLGQGNKMTPPAVLAMVTQSTRYNSLWQRSCKQNAPSLLTLPLPGGTRQKVSAGRNVFYKGLEYKSQVAKAQLKLSRTIQSICIHNLLFTI